MRFSPTIFHLIISSFIEMKKLLFLALVLTFGFSLSLHRAEAFAEESSTRYSPYSFANKRSVQEKLNDAIWRRYRNDETKQYRNGIQKSRPYQQAIHNLGKKENNVNERSTQMNRSGELKNVPYYDERQQFNNPSMIRKNPKQVFRKRVIDYYVDGGDAGSEALRSDVILGSQHQVNRYGMLNTFWKQDVQAIRDLRAVQRSLYTPPQIGAGQQRQRALNRADRTKEFMHPFMPQDYLE